MLFISCFEHFIGQKYKVIFNVYREILHKTLDEAENQKLMSQADLYNTISIIFISSEKCFRC